MAAKQQSNQKKIDKQILDSYIKRVSSPKDTLSSIEPILAEAMHVNYIKGVADIYLVQADSLRRLGDYSKSKDKCHQAINIYKSINYEQGEFETEYQLALLYKFDKKPDKAYLAFNVLSNKVNQFPKLKAKIKYQLGLIYTMIDKRSEAINELLEAIEIEKEFGDEIGLCYYYVNLGRIYLEIKNYDLALININVSEKYANKVGLDGIKADVASLKGLCLFLCNEEYTEYVNYFLYALNILEERQTPIELMNLYYNLGQIYCVNNEIENSIKYILKGIEIAASLNRNTDQKFGYYILSIAYCKLNEYENAYKYLIKSDNVLVVQVDDSKRIFKKRNDFLKDEIDKINLEIEREIYIKEYSHKNWNKRLNLLVSKVQSNEYEDKIIRKIVLNPEVLFNKYCLNAIKLGDSVKLENIDSITNNPTKQCLVFHALSPAGENISYVASIGRDFSNANFLKLNELRYVQQGLNWANLNHSLKQILISEQEDFKIQIVKKCINQRINFFKLFDLNKLNETNKRKINFNIQCKVLDYINSETASSIIVLDEWMNCAKHILKNDEISKVIIENNKSKIQEKLDEVVCKIEKENENEFENKFGFKKSDYLTILKNFSGLLNIKEITDDSLVYYFMQNKYVSDFYSSIIRFGPFEEKNWDTPIKHMFKYNNEENYKNYSGIYTKSWSFNELEGLPYSYISGNVINKLKENQISVEDLYFIGENDSYNLEKLSDFELVRLLSDLISFSIFASCFNPVFKDILEKLPDVFKGHNRNLQILPGSEEFLSFIKSSLDLSLRGNDDKYCPASLMPYLLTNFEIEQNKKGIIEFIHALNSFLANYLLPKQDTVMNKFINSITKTSSLNYINICINNHHFIDSELCPFCNEKIEKKIEFMNGDCIFCGQLCPSHVYGCNLPNETIQK